MARTRQRSRRHAAAGADAGLPDGPVADAPRALIVQPGAAGRAIARHLRERGVAPLVVDAPAEARHALAWACPELAIVEVGRTPDAWELLEALGSAGSRTFALGPRRPSAALEQRARRRGVQAVVPASEEPERIAARMVEDEPAGTDADPDTRVQERQPLVHEAAAREHGSFEGDGVLEPDAGSLEVDPLGPGAAPPVEDDGPDTQHSGPPRMDEAEEAEGPPTKLKRDPSTRAVIAAGLGSAMRLRRLAATGVGAFATIVIGLAAYQLLAPASSDAMGGAFPVEEADEPSTGEAEGDAHAKAPAEVEPEAEPIPLPTTTEEVNVLNFGEGVLAHRAGEPVDAARSYRYVLRNDGFHAGALAGLADALIRRGQLEDARPLLERLVRVRPEDRDAQLGLGLVTASLGDRDVARRALERFLDLGPNDPRRRDVRRLLAALPSASP